MLTRDYFGKLALALVEQLAKLEHDLLALCLRHIFPSGKSLFCRSNRRVDFAFVGQRYLLGDDTKSGVKNRCGSARVASYMFIGDPVANSLLCHFFAFFASRAAFCNSISARRTLMSFFTRALGSGLSTANRMLPVKTS